MKFSRETKAFRRLIWLAFGLGALAIAAIALTIMGLRRDAFEQAAREQTDLAIVLGREISASSRTIEKALDDVQSMVENARPSSRSDFLQLLSTEAVARALSSEIASAAGAEFVSIIADNGDIVNSSRAWPAPNLNVSHEDDFVYLSDRDVKSTYIGGPEVSRATNDWMIFFARRLNAPDGKFLGVIHVGMRLDHYRSIYSAISALQDKNMLLLRRDGTLLVNFPGDSRHRGERMAGNSPWYGVVAAGGGSFLSNGCFGEEPRLVAVYPLEDYPLVVDVAVSQAAVLAPWRIWATQIGAGAVLALACAGFLARAVSTQFRLLLHSEASLAAKGRDLEELNARFASVLDNMPHGVALFSGDRRLIVANKRYGEMYQLTAEEVRPGVLLDDILARRVAKGIFVQNSQSYIKTRLAEIQSPVPQQSLDRLSNGKVVFISRRPFDGGGWLTIHEDITARQLAEDRIEYMALHDQLTGSANRALLLREMRSRLQDDKGGERTLGILLVDLDEFKAVNDTHGHPFGDALLKAVAHRLREAVGERGLVARIGGDEFAVLAYETRDDEGCERLAEGLLGEIRKPFEIEGFMLSIRPSVGVARAPRDGSDVETLLKNADLALYSAKSAGRDRIGYFEPSLEREIREQRTLKAELAEAIASQQLELHFQPIVEARGGAIVELEALVRWRHPERGMIRPDHFIPLAERTGLIQEIGEFVLSAACRSAAGWPRGIGVAVNLSPAQFGRGNLVALVQRALAESELAPGRLTLEITETALMENLESSREVLRAIREMGVKIALDDFGAGYSSLSYLQSFALDKIKIDRSFVAAMETNARTRDIVALIAAIGRRLGATTVAEGVETQTQLDLVAAAGCETAQGYFFSKPKPIGELDLDAKPAEKQAA